MDNKELLKELKQIHEESKNLQYKIMSIMEIIENEQIIKSKGYNEQQKLIINDFLIEHGNVLNKDKQTLLYNSLRELNINRLTLYKLLKELNYKCKYHDNKEIDWKDLEILN